MFCHLVLVMFSALTQNKIMWSFGARGHRLSKWKHVGSFYLSVTKTWANYFTEFFQMICGEFVGKMRLLAKFYLCVFLYFDKYLPSQKINFRHLKIKCEMITKWEMVCHKDSRFQVISNFFLNCFVYLLFSPAFLRKCHILT